MSESEKVTDERKRNIKRKFKITEEGECENGHWWRGLRKKEKERERKRNKKRKRKREM